MWWWSVPSYTKNKGYKLTGVDISLEMIKLSKEICKSTNTSASLSIGDCNKLKFDDNSYDVVIAVGLIEHQKTDFAMIKEIQRILKPGGIFILTIRNYFSPYVRFRSIMSEILRFLKNTRRVLYKKENTNEEKTDIQESGTPENIIHLVFLSF